MNERVCVHGAAGSIGSSCVEIISGRNHIILDYGKELEGESSFQFVFPNSPERRKNYKVFISHSHADHAGFVAEIPQDVEVYMHEMTYKALMLQNSGYGKRSYTLVHVYEIIRWKGINIMFIPVNHSAPKSLRYHPFISVNRDTIEFTTQKWLREVAEEPIENHIFENQDKVEQRIRDGFKVSYGKDIIYWPEMDSDIFKNACIANAQNKIFVVDWRTPGSRYDFQRFTNLKFFSKNFDLDFGFISKSKPAGFESDQYCKIFVDEGY